MPSSPVLPSAAAAVGGAAGPAPVSTAGPAPDSTVRASAWTAWFRGAGHGELPARRPRAGAGGRAEAHRVWGQGRGAGGPKCAERPLPLRAPPAGRDQGVVADEVRGAAVDAHALQRYFCKRDRIGAATGRGFRVAILSGDFDPGLAVPMLQFEAARGEDTFAIVEEEKLNGVDRTGHPQVNRDPIGLGGGTDAGPAVAWWGIIAILAIVNQC